MYLPKIVYENVPYAYFATSVYCITHGDNFIWYCSAALFYLAGAMVWCSRSNARRKNSPCPNAAAFFSYRLGDSLYELSPFIYFGVGFVGAYFFENNLVMTVSVLVCILAVRNLALRIIHRNKANADLAYGKRIAMKKS
jgi:hypothetical protein